MYSRSVVSACERWILTPVCLGFTPSRPLRYDTHVYAFANMVGTTLLVAPFALPPRQHSFDQEEDNQKLLMLFVCRLGRVKTQQLRRDPERTQQDTESGVVRARPIGCFASLLACFGLFHSTTTVWSWPCCINSFAWDLCIHNHNNDTRLTHRRCILFWGSNRADGGVLLQVRQE